MVKVIGYMHQPHTLECFCGVTYSTFKQAMDAPLSLLAEATLIR
jgi:hypothetical protein